MWIGQVNCEVARELYGGFSECVDTLCSGFGLTSHLVKAVSVAKAAGVCPYKARLIEVMGAGDVSASKSVLPGKGEAVHEVLALAAPRLFREYLAAGDFAGAVSVVGEVVDEVIEELREGGVPPISARGEEGGRGTNLAAVKQSAGVMLTKFVELVRGLENRGLLDVGRSRVRAELDLFDYLMHVRGVVDLVIEDVKGGRGVVVEWKTSVGRGDAPTPDELTQSYVYALMVAHRLGYWSDDERAVLECKVFPVIIRDRGRTNPYSVSRCFRTAEKSFDEAAVLRRIKVAATHLVAQLVDLRKVDPQWHRRERRICGDENGKVVYRRIPEELTNFGYSLNPRKNSGYPCGSCPLREACRFYMFTKQNPDEVYKLAWRSRYRVFKVRENALDPYYWLARSGAPVRGPVGETGARVDIFNRIAPVEKGSALLFELRREVDREERERDLPQTVREGKPVTIFLRDAQHTVYSTNFTGTVSWVDYDDKEVVVYVSFDGKFSKMSYFIARDLLREEPHLAEGVVAVEGNVDLTQIELMAIDAFQRGVKRDWRQALPEVDEEEAKAIGFKYGYKPKMALLRLFSGL